MPTVDEIANQITQALSSLQDPPRVVDKEQYESFGDVRIELSDDQLRWRFMRERSIWSLEVAPVHHPRDWYQTDLLSYLAPDGASRTSSATLEEFIEELRSLAPRIAQEFGEARWDQTRQQLRAARRTLEIERFGAPLSRGTDE